MKALEDLAVYDDADFYDQEFTARTHAIPFFLGQAVRAGGPVLEVACGTGRVTCRSRGRVSRSQGLTWLSGTGPRSSGPSSKATSVPWHGRRSRTARCRPGRTPTASTAGMRPAASSVAFSPSARLATGLNEQPAAGLVGPAGLVSPHHDRRGGSPADQGGRAARGAVPKWLITRCVRCRGPPARGIP